MGLLDSVIGALGQAQGQAGKAGVGGGAAGTGNTGGTAGAGGLGNLGDLLGSLGGGAGGAAAGGQADLLAGVIGMLGAGGQGGGLAALVQKFQQAGLGDVVASWIGNGPNQPISGEQLGQVLGADALGGVAQQAGMNGNELMAQLAQLLPVLVDQLTPGGQLPDAGQLSSGGMQNLANLLGGALKR